MTKYIVRLNNEIVGTRNSAAGRVYTHAIVRNQPGQPVKVLSFCGTLRLAQAEANRRTSQSGGWRYEIVPVEIV